MTATVAEPKATLQSSSVWPRYPSIYEINTWVWLSEMSHKYGRTVDQFSLPSAEWEASLYLVSMHGAHGSLGPQSFRHCDFEPEQESAGRFSTHPT